MVSMMSMTGFGRGEAKDGGYTVTVELKSVNNRYRDYRFRLPSLLSFKEIEIKKKIEQHFSRGSFDIALVYRRRDDEISRCVDFKKVESYIQHFKVFSEQRGLALTINPADYLKPQFQLEIDPDEVSETLSSLSDQALKLAINQLAQSRIDEGCMLVGKIQEHAQKYQEYLTQIESRSDFFNDEVKKKLQARMAHNQDSIVEPQRVAQEIVFYLEKMDVDEEINRIHTHLKSLNEIFENGGDIGRRVDFLVQELNRETNTIASKSSHPKISQAVVEMKVHLEKIREQALNIQ